MAEPVRMVIWDLDETFWHGTLTEGGHVYRPDVHDLVIELARRGILSSICSKNDIDPVKAILINHGIWDYFVFPSINWDPKGARVAQIIEAAQLRPETVIFIDDNPQNLREAAHVVPGLQVADEHIIEGILQSELFKGKDDANLTRLAQYKLLEKRFEDKKQAGGDDNRAFLRSCNIRVSIEYDVERHLDRAIELINRTNQLNFTKIRLPEDAALARAELSSQVSKFDGQAGLVRVVDRYGDYGFVGFFLTKGTERPQRLIHFCFSCRTLGMLVEAWLYDYLGRPEIKVTGEVLTDLSQQHRVDWIAFETGATAARAMHDPVPEVRIVGGCEAVSIAHYLQARAEKVTSEGNFPVRRVFVRVNGSELLLSAADRNTAEFAEEMATMQLPVDRMVSHFFAPAPEGSVYVMGLQLDAGALTYRHKHKGWQIMLEPDAYWGDLTKITGTELAAYFDAQKFKAADREAIGSLVAHIKENYESIQGPSPGSLTTNMDKIFMRLPPGARLFLVMPSSKVRGAAADAEIRTLDWMVAYRQRLTAIVDKVPFARLVDFEDHVHSESEIHRGWGHFDRMVYFRLASAIGEQLGAMPRKPPNWLPAPTSTSALEPAT